jgi:hypothetical protein
VRGGGCGRARVLFAGSAGGVCFFYHLRKTLFNFIKTPVTSSVAVRVN